MTKQAELEARIEARIREGSVGQIWDAVSCRPGRSGKWKPRSRSSASNARIPTSWTASSGSFAKGEFSTPANGRKGASSGSPRRADARRLKKRARDARCRCLRVMLVIMATRVLVPEDRNGRRAADYLARAVFAHAFHRARAADSRSPSPEAFARQRWGDRVTEILTRAAAGPASMGDPDWAGALARTAVADFIASLAALSAGARLLAAAPSVSLDGVQQVTMPRRLGADQ
jgi:hypothetical protein